MEILKTVPAKENHPHRVNKIEFNLDERAAYVTIEPSAESHQTVKVAILPILSGATATQQTTIKAFFKKIVSIATEIAEIDLPEVIEE